MKPTSSKITAAAVVPTALAFLVALGFVFGYAPVEARMGIVQKIFYFHVPSAIAAYIGFLVCCVASIIVLLNRSELADAVARAGAEVGVMFCLIVLGTGPLWAKPIWGTFWTGEPRLMLTLVLVLIFAAYLVVRSFGGPTEATRRICAVLAILGTADIPLIRVATKRWRGNHPRVISEGGGGISDEMFVTLMVCFVAVLLLFVTLLAMRIRLAAAEQSTERIHRVLADHEATLEDLRLSRSSAS